MTSVPMSLPATTLPEVDLIAGGPDLHARALISRNQVAARRRSFPPPCCWSAGGDQDAEGIGAAGERPGAGGVGPDELPTTRFALVPSMSTPAP